MKKLKIFTIFIIIFFFMANYSYAFQIQQDILASNSVNVNSSNFKIEKIELSKSSDAKSLALSEKCTINEVTVVDNVYDKEENSKDITTTDVSTNAVSVDLSLNSLTAAKQPFEVGKVAKFHFTIANYGPDNATGTNIRVDVDGSPVGNIPLGTILAGYQYNIEFDLTGPSEGIHEIKLFAVLGYGLVDTDLSNNTITKNFLWLGVPDLVASSFETVSGSTSFKTDEEIKFKFTVTNKGTGKAYGTINNQIVINDEIIGNIPISGGLDVNYMATVSFTVSFSKPGTKYMRIHVNTDVTISESDYSNNIAVTTVSITPAPAFLSYGWPTSIIPIRPYSFSSTWQTPMNDSISNWNNAGAEITFNKDSSSDNIVTVGNYGDEYYGLCTSQFTGSELIRFEIKLNSKTISNDAANFSNFVQSVFVHELGHTIWLADNPYTTSSSIMKYTRDRNTMTKPQTYDINNVKTKY